MNDSEILIAHNIFINKGAYAVLLGSGISRSAGIPTGWEILKNLIGRLAILKGQPIVDNHENWYKEQYKAEPNYSKIIEFLTTTQEERVSLLKPFFEVTETENSESIKKPTIAHKAIASLINKGYIKVVITTNFDRLMENALREIGIEASVISNPNHIENVMPLIHSPITIIKVNGDYLDTKFLNSESELNAYDDRLVSLLKYVFENFGLVTTGWSAKWDIGLREILESSNKFRFSNFFTYLNKYEDEFKRVSDLRNGRLVQIKDANSFFKEILENIEALEKGEKDNPLAKPIAIERLKKYIQKQESKIDLYDLIDAEVKKDFKAIRDKILPRPDINVIKDLIEFDINKLDLLYSLIIQGVYWGNTLHHEIWLKAISKFAHPTLQTGNDTDLSYFPSLILFYAIGLTALYKEDFLLLRKLFSIQIFNPYNEGEKINILTRVNTYMVDKDTLNSVYGNTQYVPMSELLYKTFKPEFEMWLSNEKEFDELFDRFELLNSLQFIEKFKDGFLPGRFIHTRRRSNNIIYKKFEELNVQKENNDWIQEGLFKDFDSLKKSYDYFNENIKKYPF